MHICIYHQISVPLDKGFPSVAKSRHTVQWHTDPAQSQLLISRYPKYSYCSLIKANRTLRFPRWNLNRCKQEVKANVYCTLVRSGLKYASKVRDPYHATHIKDLKVILWGAARFVYPYFEKGNSNVGFPPSMTYYKQTDYVLQNTEEPSWPHSTQFTPMETSECAVGTETGSS